MHFIVHALVGKLVAFCFMILPLVDVSCFHFSFSHCCMNIFFIGMSINNLVF